MTKYSKHTVSYEPKARGADHCAVCSHYLNRTTCEIVEGKIAPEGWCKKFYRKRRGRSGDY